MIEISSGAVGLTKIAHQLVKDFSAKRNEPDEFLQKSIQRHMTYIEDWSHEVGFVGMDESAQPLDTHAVPMSAEFGARKFRATTAKQNSASVRDLDLLLGRNSHLLLGDPGAGKTTVVKRLIRALLFPNEYEVNIEKVTAAIPVLVRCRLSQSASLIVEIAKALGIKFQIQEIKTVVKGKETSQTEYSVNEERLQDYITDLLSSMNVCLFVDGLDEIDADRRGTFVYQMGLIARSTINCKVIATSRPGDFSFAPDGMKMVELLPFSPKDIRQMAERWAQSPSKFLKSVKKKTYFDTINRPLILMQIITLYNASGILPEQGIYIQDRILFLLLEAWDSKRGIRRETKYSEFMPEEKRRFLSDLAYFLLYEKGGKKIFGRADIIDFYETTHEKYGLPAKEALKVAKEIESHTGIIVSISDTEYEFGHLSTQEHLAAMKVVSLPGLSQVAGLISSYAPPVAVAVAISQTSSDFLFELLTWHKKHTRREGDLMVNLQSFLARLVVEKPPFEVGYPLALSYLYLSDHFRSSNNETALKLLNGAFYRLPSVKSSVDLLLSQVENQQTKGHVTKLTLRAKSDCDPVLLNLLSRHAISQSSSLFVAGDFLNSRYNELASK